MRAARALSPRSKFQADKGDPQSARSTTPRSPRWLRRRMQLRLLAQALQAAPIFLTDNVTINALVHLNDEHDGRTGMLAATNAGLYRTYDPTAGWEKVPYGEGLDIEPRTLCISTSEQNPNTVYVGTAKLGVLSRARRKGNRQEFGRDHSLHRA